MAEVGEGNLNWSAILAACKEAKRKSLAAAEGAWREARAKRR